MKSENKAAQLKIVNRKSKIVNFKSNYKSQKANKNRKDFVVKISNETMSTLPFLLSVADELDNIHTQSYMDDFGLGFHPHRQYYRTPTIQLSLPASSDWTGREWQGRHARYRSYKFYDDTQNNLEEVDEESQRYF